MECFLPHTRLQFHKVANQNGRSDQDHWWHPENAKKQSSIDYVVEDGATKLSIDYVMGDGSNKIDNISL